MQVTKTALIVISVIGIGMVLALFDSEAKLAENGGWYALGVIMALSVLMPREMACLSGLVAMVTIGHAVLISGAPLFGLYWPHAIFFVVLCSLLFLLTPVQKIEVYRCTDCFWSGPVTRLANNRCPKCGGRHVKYAHRSMMAS